MSVPGGDVASTFRASCEKSRSEGLARPRSAIACALRPPTVIEEDDRRRLSPKETTFGNVVFLTRSAR